MLSQSSISINFFTPWNLQKICGVLTFWGGIEIEHWAKNRFWKLEKIKNSHIVCCIIKKNPLLVFRQVSIICADADECVRNVHAKTFLRARNYVHINQSKHLVVVLRCYYDWRQIRFNTIRSDIHKYNIVKYS